MQHTLCAHMYECCTCSCIRQTAATSLHQRVPAANATVLCVPLVPFLRVSLVFCLPRPSSIYIWSVCLLCVVSCSCISARANGLMGETRHTLTVRICHLSASTLATNALKCLIMRQVPAGSNGSLRRPVCAAAWTAPHTYEYRKTLRRGLVRLRQ